MKILCDRNQLQEAFSFVAGIAPQKTTKPILQNVLLEATDDGVALFCTDFEISARVSVDSVKVITPGRALLPARQTNALLRELSDPTVTLESKEFRCTLTSGGGSFVLVGDDPEQFPSEVQLGEGDSITLPAGIFLDMVRKTMFAAAREESRYMINGVLFDCRDDCLRLVATDGRRLALNYTNQIECHLNGPDRRGGVAPGEGESGAGESGGGEAPDSLFKSVVPIRALHLLNKTISDEGQTALEITFTPNKVGFRFGNSSLVSQLLEANFPDYEMVMPKAADTTCELNKELLERNVRKVAVLSSGDLPLIRMQFNSQTLDMSAETSGVGRAEQVMDVDIRGAGGTLSFNPDYLLEALKVTDQDVVRLDMSDDSTPAKMTLGESFTYILMPISGS